MKKKEHKNISKKKVNILKLSVLLVTLIFLIGITIFSVKIAFLLMSEDGRTQIAEKTKSFGPFAPLAYIALNVMRIAIPFIPGEPVEILGGVLFGAIWSAVYCLMGVFIGSLTAWKLVKRFGRSLTDKIINSKKIERFKFLKNEKKLETVVFTLFFLPVFPKDVLTYIIPLTTNINPRKYFPICTFARFPSIITSTIVGASLGNGHFLSAVLIFAITAIIGYIAVLSRK